MLAADRGSGFAEMNSHLVRSTGLQPAFNQSEVARIFDNANMGDRSLS
jgi:hypothetical protein